MRYISGYRELIENFFEYGITGLIEELRNRRSLWSIFDVEGALISRGSFGSSISDVPEYISICKAASENEEILRKFKRCYEYRLVLEHVSRKQGEEYLRFIDNEESILKVLRQLASKEIGEPFRYSFPQLGKISPTQIRYAKILRDIRLLFPTFQGGKVVEIGVGNGGLAAQISCYFQPSAYSLVDLPEVLALTSKILDTSESDTEFQFVSPSNASLEMSDLFISNYAYSELTKEVQDFYYRNYIVKAKAGYMIYNHIHKNSATSYSALEMKNLIPGSEIFSETPLTYPGNVLLVWGHDKISDSVLGMNR